MCTWTQYTKHFQGYSSKLEPEKTLKNQARYILVNLIPEFRVRDMAYIGIHVVSWREMPLSFISYVFIPVTACTQHAVCQEWYVSTGRMSPF